jgi:hypothetical protein
MIRARKNAAERWLIPARNRYGLSGDLRTMTSTTAGVMASFVRFRAVADAQRRLYP